MKDVSKVYRTEMVETHALRDLSLEVREGEILSDAELTDLGTLFPDRYFGELIFLVEEGRVVVGRVGNGGPDAAGQVRIGVGAIEPN